jgi:hypothetical protein
VPASQASYKIDSLTLDATAVPGSTSGPLPSTLDTTVPSVPVTVASAARPASTGHRKRAVATRTTIRAQPTAAAEVASEALRALKMINTPIAAMTNGIHEANRFWWRAVETSSTAPSNPPRKSGANATCVTEPVRAVRAIGSCTSQLLIAVPMTASGCRIASGPQPRS